MSYTKWGVLLTINLIFLQNVLSFWFVIIGTRFFFECELRKSNYKDGYFSRLWSLQRKKEGWDGL